MDVMFDIKVYPFAKSIWIPLFLKKNVARLNDTMSDTEEETVFYQSETETDLEYSTDDEDEEILEFIYQREAEFLNADKQHDHYYLGVCKYISQQNHYVLLNAITAKTFLENPYLDCIHYLREYSIVWSISPTLDILKLQIHPITGTYTVLIKTYWLRLIQRHWRARLRQRERVQHGRCCFRNWRIFEMTGRFPNELRNLPGIHGLLSIYQKSANRGTD